MKIISVFAMNLVLVVLIMAGLVWADDSAELADLQARIATLEATRMAPSGGGDAESLTSIRKNGMVGIGGQIEIGIRRTSIDKATENESAGQQSGYAGAGKPPNPARTVQSDLFDADLDIRVDAGPDTHLFLKLDMDDTGSDGDLVEEANFTWENVRGSNWTVIFGKDEVFFGQDKSSGINELYNHGTGGGAKAQSSYLSDHTYLGDGTLGQGELDNTIQLGLQYKYRNLLKAEFSFFQNPHTSGQVYGINNDQPEDNGLQSYAGRLWYTPIEGLKLEVSYINRHNGAQGDNTAATATTSTVFGTENISALSLGSEYKIGAWDFYGEYIHTWDAAYLKDIDVNVITAGVAYDLTESINLYVEGGWSGSRNEVNRNFDEWDEDLFMGVIGAIYTFDNGIYLQGEYAREWYRNSANDDDGLGDTDSAQANVVNFQVGWKF